MLPPGAVKQQADRMTRNALAAAGKTEALFSRRFDADLRGIDAAGVRKVPAHRKELRRQLRTLRQHRRIEIADLPSL